MPPHGHSSFWRYLLRPGHIALILSISFGTMLVEHWGWLHGFESAALDSLLIFKRPKRAEQVVIVDIGDDDYRELFQGRSPLDPAALGEIIAGIALCDPQVIGVDIDTSGPAFRALRALRPSMPLVWAQPAWVGERGANEHARGLLGQMLNPFAHESERVVVGSVLGGRAKGLRSGVAVMPMDRDGVVRRYLREVEEEGGGGRRPSLPWAIVVAAGGGRPEPEPEAVLNFAGSRFTLNRLPASIFHEMADERAQAGAAWEAPEAARALRGKVVLLGGSYREARDGYVTPLGPMNGVDLIATAIESELRGRGIREASHALKIAFDILAACLLIYVSHRFPLRMALLLGFAGIPLLAMAGSYLLFSSLAYWISFAPVLIGVWVHQAIHHAMEYKRLCERLVTGGSSP